MGGRPADGIPHVGPLRCFANCYYARLVKIRSSPIGES